MKAGIPSGAAVLLLVALVVLIAGVAAVGWFVVRRSARLWRLLAPHVATAAARMRRSPLLARARGRYPRSVAFLADRVSLTRYLGLYLTIGLALSLAALVAFARLASEVLLERELRELDGAAAWIAELLRSPASDRVFEFVTTLGNPLTWAALTVVVIVALSVRREWLLAILSACVTGLELARRRGASVAVASHHVARPPGDS